MLKLAVTLLAAVALAEGQKKPRSRCWFKSKKACRGMSKAFVCKPDGRADVCMDANDTDQFCAALGCSADAPCKWNPKSRAWACFEDPCAKCDTETEFCTGGSKKCMPKDPCARLKCGEEETCKVLAPFKQISAKKFSWGRAQCVCNDMCTEDACPAGMKCSTRPAKVPFGKGKGKCAAQCVGRPTCDHCAGVENAQGTETGDCWYRRTDNSAKCKLAKSEGGNGGRPGNKPFGKPDVGEGGDKDKPAGNRPFLGNKPFGKPDGADKETQGGSKPVFGNKPGNKEDGGEGDQGKPAGNRPFFGNKPGGSKPVFGNKPGNKEDGGEGDQGKPASGSVGGNP